MTNFGRMTATTVLGVLLVGALTVPAPASAVELLWRRRYDGAARSQDFGTGVALAGDGSVYVCGFTAVKDVGPDLLLLKYSSSGDLLWDVTFNGAAGKGERAFGVAVGSRGAVYVTGYAMQDGEGQNLLLQRYAPAGDLLWSRTFNGVASGNDYGAGVAVGPDGSVCVVGATTVADGGYALLLRKYSAAGRLLWSRTVEGTDGGDAYGGGVVVGRDGSVYVTGSIREGRRRVLLLQAYSAAGEVRWTTTYGSDSVSAAGSALALRPDGGIYVTGGYLLQRYTASGGLLWSRSLPSQYLWPAAQGSGVAVAPNGGVFLAGGFYERGRPVILLARYSDAGTRRWEVTSQRGNGSGSGVAVGSDGSIYVAGSLHFPDKPSDVFLRRYR